jgi:hypothetical protein
LSNSNIDNTAASSTTTLTEVRSYNGASGELRFRTGEVIECREFKLTLYTTGKLTLECTTSFTVDFCRILRRSNQGYNPFPLITASFTGTTRDGGTLQITEVTLDDKTFQNEPYTSFDEARSEYRVNLDSATKIIKNCSYGDLIAQPKGNRIIIGKMTFLPIAEVTINFERVHNRDTVSVIWGLTNLEFEGCERHAGSLDPDSFTVNIDKRKFIIYHVDDYKQKIKELKSTETEDITANVTAAALCSELPEVELTLEKACVLLSFATMNWVTTLFRDVFRDGRLISATLLPHFTLPFKKAYHVIDTRNGDNCPLRRFVETGYNRYTEFKDIFQLRFVLEYYISAARAHSPENQFAIAYLALDCLASKAPEYIEHVGDKKLENPGAVSRMEKRLQGFFKGRNLGLSSKDIHDLANEIAYKESDEIKIDYLIDKFGVDFDKNTVYAVTSFRGRFMHTGRDRECKSYDHYHNVLSILERTLLTMFGWKGNEYVDKLSGFTVRTLN